MQIMKKRGFSYLGNIILMLSNKCTGSIRWSWLTGGELEKLFKGFEFARENFRDEFLLKRLTKNLSHHLIDAYRKRHLFYKTNPVRTAVSIFPHLTFETSDYQGRSGHQYSMREEIGLGPASLRNIVDHLNLHIAECRAEYMFIGILKAEMADWQNGIRRNLTHFTDEEKRNVPAPQKCSRLWKIHSQKIHRAETFLSWGAESWSPDW